MGQHLTIDSYGTFLYKLVRRVWDSPSRIYFDTSILGILDLAFDTPVPSPVKEQPLLPQPESASPSHSQRDKDYFYISATLDSVVEMTPCQVSIVDFGPAVIGLLRYKDSQQASFRQTQLDMLESPMKVDPKTKLCLHFALSSTGCPNVSSVTLETKMQAGLMPLHGTLEW